MAVATNKRKEHIYLGGVNITAYTGIIENVNTITIDGYSNAKTILGAMRDIERLINKIDCVSSQLSLYSFDNKKEVEELLNTCTIENSCDGFYVTIEEVPCASNWIEEKEEMEYKDGYNYYFCTD